MFQFGEILTLAVGLVTLVYVLRNWQRIRRDRHLRPFLGAVLLFAASWLFTVLEGVFLPDVPLNQVILFGRSVGRLEEGGPGTAVCNFLEHAALLAGGVWLAVAVFRLGRARRRTGP